MQSAIEDPLNDYIDGIMYAYDSGVICIGRLTNDVKDQIHIQRFTRPTDPWFYLHVKKLMRGKLKPVTEAVPIVDYLFRYDRGGFWVAVYAFKYFITPFNWITRWALDGFMHTRVMYHALHQSGLYAQNIIQDVAIPYPKSIEFFEYLQENFTHYPIWLCPLKYYGQSTDPVLNRLSLKTSRPAPEVMLNFGIWGPGPKNRRKFIEWNRDFERTVAKFGGQKALYAHTYYTEQEFDEIYDRKSYDALREKYHATYLPSVYEKVKVDIEAEEKALQENWNLWLIALFWNIWPLAGLYGVYKAAFGGDYLLPRTSKKT